MTNPTATGPSRNTRVIWLGAAVVVALLAVVAILASQGGDKKVDGQTSKVAVGDTATSTSVDENGGSGSGVSGQKADVLPLYDATTDDPAIGMTIPKVTGKDFDGNDITIGPDGKAKIILFVAHWCPHCQREVPLLKAHLDDHPMPNDVELLTVSTSVKPGADNYPPQDWLNREGWSAPVLADDEASSVANAYGLSAFPYFVAVDADGKVVQRASGELSTDQFDAAVKAAQTGKS